MSESDQERLDSLFEDFERGFHAGEGPDALDYLERAGGNADALAARISRFLATSAPPGPTEERIAEMLRDPALTLAAAPSYGELLKRGRKARDLSRANFARRLAEELGATSKQAKVKRYYADLENGLLSPRGLDDRVVEAITRLLNLPRRRLGALARAWRSPAPGDQGAAAAFARSGQPLPAESRPAPEEPSDEVDRLFAGGL